MYLHTFIINVLKQLGFSINANVLAIEIFRLLGDGKKVEAIKTLHKVAYTHIYWNWNDSCCYTDSVYEALKATVENEKRYIGLKEAKDIIEFIYQNLNNFKT